MNNTSIFRISKFQVPIAERQPRFLAMVYVFMAYMQMLILRLEMFIERSNLEARMTPQVCYLEKILRMSVSPWCEINRLDLVLYQIDEVPGSDVFINDNGGVVLYSDSDADQYDIVVNIPSTGLNQQSYIIDLINKYRLPSMRFGINFITPAVPHLVDAYTNISGTKICAVFDEPMDIGSILVGRGFYADGGPLWNYESLSEDRRTITYACVTPVLAGDYVILATDYDNYQPLKSIYGGVMAPLNDSFPVTNNVVNFDVTVDPEYLVPAFGASMIFTVSDNQSSWVFTAGDVNIDGTGATGFQSFHINGCYFEFSSNIYAGGPLVISLSLQGEEDPFENLDSFELNLEATSRYGETKSITGILAF